MEEELKCAECRDYLVDPVLLHCAHSYCRACALAKQVRASTLLQQQPPLQQYHQPLLNNSNNLHLDCHQSKLLPPLSLVSNASGDSRTSKTSLQIIGNNSGSSASSSNRSSIRSSGGSGEIAGVGVSPVVLQQTATTKKISGSSSSGASTSSFAETSSIRSRSSLLCCEVDIGRVAPPPASQQPPLHPNNNNNLIATSTTPASRVAAGGSAGGGEADKLSVDSGVVLLHGNSNNLHQPLLAPTQRGPPSQSHKSPAASASRPSSFFLSSPPAGGTLCNSSASTSPSSTTSSTASAAQQSSQQSQQPQQQQHHQPWRPAAQLPSILSTTPLLYNSPPSSTTSVGVVGGGGVGGVGYAVVCARCQRPSHYPDADYLRVVVPRNVAIQRVLDRFLKANNIHQLTSASNKQQTNTKLIIATTLSGVEETSGIAKASISGAQKSIAAGAAAVSAAQPPCQWCVEDGENHGDEEKPGGRKGRLASFHCEQCGYSYCTQCQPVIHPLRGPLRQHCLVEIGGGGRRNSTTLALPSPVLPVPPATPPLSARSEKKVSGGGGGGDDGASSSSCQLLRSTCEPWHPGEPLTLYCQVCRQAVCSECVREAKRHQGHEVQSLSAAVKQQKADFSHSLQLLSEKAKVTNEQLGQMKQLQERINSNCSELKSQLNAEFDTLLGLVEQRRAHLLSIAESQLGEKLAAVRERLADSNRELNQARGLIHLGIELLKEPEPLAYLQVGGAMANRVAQQDYLWPATMGEEGELTRARRSSLHLQLVDNELDSCGSGGEGGGGPLAEFHLTLDTRELQAAIGRVEFSQMKVPPPPHFIPAQCWAENNSISLAWTTCLPDDPATTAVGVPIDSYSLELSGRFADEDGEENRAGSSSGGGGGLHFKPVYSGREPCCLLEGLRYNAHYFLRVRSRNVNGESEPSETISFRTAARAAWFRLQPPTAPAIQQELLISNESCSLTSTSLDYRTVRTEPGFHSGTHYWEVQVDRLDASGNSDVVVGVAQAAFNESTMLGMDLHGWSMYVDRERSWFLHNGSHHGRRQLLGAMGELAAGSVIRVKLDCDRGELTFYLNDIKVGGDEPAFKNMPRGVYYAAFSVNRSVAITVQPGLTPPPSPPSLLPSDRPKMMTAKKESCTR